MQNFGVTNKEHYGMLWYFLEWSILIHRAFIAFAQRCDSKENNPSSERVGPRLSGITVRMRGFGFADVKKKL